MAFWFCTQCFFLGVIVCLCGRVVGAFLHPSQMRQPTLRINTRIRSQGGDIDGETVEKVRAAVFQAPARSGKQPDSPLGPLEVLTEVADSLRVASMHGVDVVVYPEQYLCGDAGRLLDRESYELNIVGNLCEELNVACVIGYTESVYENELEADDDGSKAYNSIAAFHADGSRAGNYRSVSASFGSGDESLRRGSPFVEFIPTTLQLPIRDGSTQQPKHRREIKCGVMCGNDMLSPEHCRHLVRCGAQAMFAPSSFRKNNRDLRLVKHVLPTRAIENGVPVVCANKLSQGSEPVFIGSSAIISQDGDYCVYAPEEEDGDMPCDQGYLIPCKVGTLYAADISIDSKSPASPALKESLDKWELNPTLPDVISGENHSGKAKGKGGGFGRHGATKRKMKKGQVKL